MNTINMLSSAEKVKGQGVMSAYLEQVSLVREGLHDDYDIFVNKVGFCDIMHYHTIDFQHFLFLPLAKLKGTAVGYVHFLPETVDGSLNLPTIAKKVFYWYIIKFYKSMDLLVTVNPLFVDKLVGYGIPREKIFYIPNFVSDSDFYPLEGTRKLRHKEEFGYKPDDFVVLGVGQLQTRKGVEDFIKIARAMPEMQFVWAGGFSFGAFSDGYAELKKQVENPPKNLKFTGIVEREVMNDLYNMADVMFLPSYSELFPMTILEAMNCELPLLLRDLPEYKEILSSWYLKGNNNQEFIAALSELRTNQDFYQVSQDKSREGKAFYSKDSVLKMWEQFYARALGIKKGGRRKVYEKRLD